MHPPEFTLIDCQHGISRVTRVRNNAVKWGLLDNEGRELLPAVYDYIQRPVRNDLFAVFTGSFEWDEYEEATFELFHELIDDRKSWNGDYYEATLGEGVWGLVNERNEAMLPVRYNALYFYSDTIVVVNEGGSRIIKWHCGDEKEEKWSVVGGAWKALTLQGATLAEMSSNEQQFDFHSRLNSLQPWDPKYKAQVIGAYFE
ncbi:MAG: WG repeat-containing protein [Chitinophagaceae bacterium]|nr:MAG: WG repeat-containing protein [Chitinophagaceae bacterium]